MKCPFCDSEDLELNYKPRDGWNNYCTNCKRKTPIEQLPTADPERERKEIERLLEYLESKGYLMDYNEAKSELLKAEDYYKATKTLNEHNIGERFEIPIDQIKDCDNVDDLKIGKIKKEYIDAFQQYNKHFAFLFHLAEQYYEAIYFDGPLFSHELFNKELEDHLNRSL